MDTVPSTHTSRIISAFEAKEILGIILKMPGLETAILNDNTLSPTLYKSVIAFKK